LRESPTRFGRIGLTFESAGTRGWRLQFERVLGPMPGSITIPETIADLHFEKMSGAPYKQGAGRIEVDPKVPRWEAFWKSAT